MIRLFAPLLAAALLAPVLVLAQTTTTTVTTTESGVPPSLQVSRIAPQLIAFAGGQTNFDNLVNGLALGTPVSLVSALTNGQVQTVTFTPQGTMTPTAIAQTLESARQGLISRGVGAPTGQQVAVSLVGGVLPTQTGNVQVTALLPAANQPAQLSTAAAGATATPTSPVTTSITQPAGAPSPAALLQGQSGSGGGTTPPSPAAIIQQQRGSNISDTPTSGNISNTPNAAATTGTTTPTPSVSTTGTSGPESAAVRGGERGAPAGSTAPAAPAGSVGR